MTTNTVQGGQPLTPAVRAGIRNRMAQVLISFLIQGALLFWAAGRVDWLWAWLFLGLNLAGMAVNAAFLLRHSPETVAARARTQGAKGWDRWVGGAWAIAHFFALLVVAGLDQRFGWSAPFPTAGHLAGAALFTAGFALFSWAMLVNAYFTTMVRIQTERGHQVCTAGPYRVVRHPGYVGAILQSLGMPLLLGSTWALVPGGVAVLLMLIRTALEDRTLHTELDGYRDYAQRVRARLLPGVW